MMKYYLRLATINSHDSVYYVVISTWNSSGTSVTHYLYVQLHINMAAIGISKTRTYT